MPRPPNAPYFGLRLPPRARSIIETEAGRLTVSRSALVRELLIDALKARGLWPPPLSTEKVG
jgi:hypothetical protein